MTHEQTTQRSAAPRVIIGRYTVLGELGRGGMGVVWRGEDTVIGRQVAIKELRPPDGIEDGLFTERVMREVRNGGRINDPAVVTVYDVVSADGATFIVMELVEAPTLSALVRAQGPLPPAQAAHIGRQVLSALQSAHQAGIVHRDVKPGNIMVSPTGRVKLTDFGIAQAVDDPRLTTSGMIIGSPAFMAPERISGNEATAASDLWALGATLFFAVEGTGAYDRPTTAATLHAIINEVPYLTRIQGPLASVIMGLLIANPVARISAEQADGLLAMVSPAGHGGANGTFDAHPATLRSPGSGPTMIGARPARRRRRLWIPLGAVLGVLLVVAGWLLGWWWASDPAMQPTLTYGADGDVPTLDTSSSYDCTSKLLNPGDSLTDKDWVDCDKLHYLEFYASTTLFSPTDSEATTAAYPDDARLRRLAESFCAVEFYSKTRGVSDTGTLNYRALVPSHKAWDTQAAKNEPDYPLREIDCVLGKRDGSSYQGASTQKVK